ncbi:MAG: CinA family protein [Muribaculaceae bacterium]|nr:CinA family protein [Muribaculaceae bacterium]
MNKKKEYSESGKAKDLHTETRHLVIYGYTLQELNKIIRHFEAQLPEFVKISIETTNLVTKVTLTGINSGLQLLRFNVNRYHSNLNQIFTQDVVATEDKTVAQVLGELLHERELTVSCAESCTGGNLAHRIVQVPGSSSYFLGSVVSYANDVKTDVLGVPKADISRDGAVSKTVAEAMARGAARLMRTDCAIATTGIAGPEGGTRFKPVGTVWIAVKYGDTVVSECIHFKGDRNNVIESATNHGMVMLINLLRNTYEMQEDVNDD